jgi:hypothetical protein
MASQRACGNEINGTAALQFPQLYVLRKPVLTCKIPFVPGTSYRHYPSPTVRVCSKGDESGKTFENVRVVEEKCGLFLELPGCKL